MPPTYQWHPLETADILALLPLAPLLPTDYKSTLPPSFNNLNYKPSHCEWNLYVTIAILSILVYPLAFARLLFRVKTSKWDVQIDDC